MGATAKVKVKTFRDSTYELAEILRSDQEAIEKADFEIGKKLVSIYEDGNFSLSMNGLRQAKITSIEDAIEDISLGAENLKSGNYGVWYTQNQFKTRYVLHNEKVEGTVVYSISLAEFVAFKNWRQTEGNDYPQEKINASIYYLTVLLSELI